MRWSERQRAMLREMGIRIWAPESAAASGEEAGETATLVAEPVAAAVAPIAPIAPASASSLASADWLVVGEPFDAAAADRAAAAEQELLLDNMLRAIRVARGGEGRTGRACHFALDLVTTAAGLDAAIATVRPKVILALGRAAGLALLGVDEPLGRLRERVHERAGIPVVVTFALPYLLRHAEDKPRAWADLCRAVAAIG